MSIASAYDDTIGEYVSPLKAEKGHTFSCVDCKQKVMFRKGTVRVAHFAHYSSTNTCTYFDHPSESQQHKDAKVKLAEWLRYKRVACIGWSCPNKKGLYVCNKMYECSHNIQYQDGDSIQLEYRDPSGKYIADIAVLNNGVVRYIFEILHTHRTVTECRPEPWFEIHTAEIFENARYDFDHWELTCCRSSPVRHCYECKLLKEDWLNQIPVLNTRIGKEQNWVQEAACIKCWADRYSPVWHGGVCRRLCKICLSTHTDVLRQKYSLSKPLFR